jgi:Putative adhesin
VDIVVSREALTSDQSEAQKIFAEVPVAITQHGDVIEVAAHRTSELSGWFGNPRLRLHYTITVPRRFNVDLKTSGGDVHVGDVEGSVTVASSGGDLNLDNIVGQLTASTSGGNVRLASCRAPAVLRSSGGDLDLGTVSGATEATTSGGDIRVQRADAKLVVKTSGGDITLHQIGAATEARTSGGSIHATLVAQPAAESIFSTSGGEVDIAMHDGIRVDLDAKTSGGRVENEFPVTIRGTTSRSELQGKINGGGPSLVLRSSGGSIALRRIK